MLNSRIVDKLPAFEIILYIHIQERQIAGSIVPPRNHATNFLRRDLERDDATETSSNTRYISKLLYADSQITKFTPGIN